MGSYGAWMAQNYENAKESIKALEQRIRDLEARNAALIEGLRPFAEALNHDIGTSVHMHDVINLKDLQHAKDLMEKQ